MQREVKAQIELGSNNNSLRKYVFRKPKLTLDDLLLDGRTLETADSQAKLVEANLVASGSSATETSEVNKIGTKAHGQSRKFGYRKFPKKTVTGKPPNSVKARNCFSCGGSFPHTGPCPARKKTCNSCKRVGHFSKVCRSRTGKSGRLNAVEVNGFS